LCADPGLCFSFPVAHFHCVAISGCPSQPLPLKPATKQRVVHTLQFPPMSPQLFPHALFFPEGLDFYLPPIRKKERFFLSISFPPPLLRSSFLFFPVHFSFEILKPLSFHFHSLYSCFHQMVSYNIKSAHFDSATPFTFYFSLLSHMPPAAPPVLASSCLLHGAPFSPELAPPVVGGPPTAFWFFGLQNLHLPPISNSPFPFFLSQDQLKYLAVGTPLPLPITPILLPFPRTFAGAAAPTHFFHPFQFPQAI